MASWSGAEKERRSWNTDCVSDSSGEPLVATRHRVVGLVRRVDIIFATLTAPAKRSDCEPCAGPVTFGLSAALTMLVSTARTALVVDGGAAAKEPQSNEAHTLSTHQMDSSSQP